MCRKSYGVFIYFPWYVCAHSPISRASLKKSKLRCATTPSQTMSEFTSITHHQSPHNNTQYIYNEESLRSQQYLLCVFSVVRYWCWFFNVGFIQYNDSRLFGNMAETNNYIFHPWVTYKFYHLSCPATGVVRGLRISDRWVYCLSADTDGYRE